VVTLTLILNPRPRGGIKLFNLLKGIRFIRLRSFNRNTLIQWAAGYHLQTWVCRA